MGTESARNRCGFGGLVVIMLAFGTQDRGFAPGRSRRIFSGENILSMPSFGKEVKPFAPYRRFARMSKNPITYRGSRKLYAKLFGRFSPASVPR
jgi:hypothetical protein